MPYRKKRPDWQKGKLNGIGGKINSGELPSFAMEREFEEETGVSIPSYEWLYVTTMLGRDWECHVFTCHSDKIFIADTKEDETVLIIGLDELERFDLISNLYWLIEMCRDAKYIDYTIANLYGYFMHIAD